MRTIRKPVTLFSANLRAWPSYSKAPGEWALEPDHTTRKYSVEKLPETYCCSRCGAIDFRRPGQLKDICIFCALPSTTK